MRWLLCGIVLIFQTNRLEFVWDEWWLWSTVRVDVPIQLIDDDDDVLSLNGAKKLRPIQPVGVFMLY